MTSTLAGNRNSLSRIFEPFFLTKRGGKSKLGLGLSISKEIAEKLGGQITFATEKGKGSIFKIILPIKGKGRGLHHGEPGANPDCG